MEFTEPSRVCFVHRCKSIASRISGVNIYGIVVMFYAVVVLVVMSDIPFSTIGKRKPFIE